MSDDIDIVDHEVIDEPQAKCVFLNYEFSSENYTTSIIDDGVDVTSEYDDDDDDVTVQRVSGTQVPKPTAIDIVKDEPFNCGEPVITLVDSDDEIDIKPILPIASVENDSDSSGEVIMSNKIILGYKRATDVIHNCQLCNIYFGSKTRLDKHKEAQHKVIDKDVTSKDKSLKSIIKNLNYSNDDFENTIIVSQNDNDKLHACFHCDEKFSTKDDVIDHLHLVMDNKKMLHKKNTAKAKKRKIEIAAKIQANKKHKIENKRRIIKTKSISHSKPIVHDLKECYVLLDREIIPRKKNKKIIPRMKKAKKINLKQCSVVVKKLNSNTIDAYIKRVKVKCVRMEVMESNHSDNNDIITTSNDCSKLNTDIDEDLQDNDHYEKEEHDKKKKTSKSKSQLHESDRANKYKKYFKCVLCTCYFCNKTAFDKHMRTIHHIKTPKINMKSVFNPYCTFCDVKSKSVAEYNQHIQQNTSTHVNKTYDLNNFEYYIYRCLICKDEFSTKRMLYKHRARKHDNCTRGITTEIITNKEYFDKIQKKDFPERFSYITAYGKLNRPIPKDVLFRCALCSCHFINARATKVHYTKCSQGQCSRKYRCTKCNLDINMLIKDVHSKQHELTDDFKVYDVDEERDSFFDRLLYLCPKCGVYYGEVRFWKHYPLCGENPPESKYCAQCDILIDEAMNQKKTHDQKHKMVKEFVIVEYVDLEQNVDVVHEETKARKKVIPKRYLLLYYCKNCKSFFRNAGGRQTLAHSENRCKRLPKIICQVCGLVTTQRAYATHKLQHKWDNLKLLDYTFYDFLNNECIDPPFPHFPYCKQCDTYFENINTIMKHKCDEIINKVCKSCDEKFTPHAHMLHTFYHDYRLNKKNRLKIHAKNIYLKKKVTHSDNEPKVKKRDSDSKKRKHKKLKTKTAKPSHFLYKCMDCELVVDDTEAKLHKKVNDCTNLASKYKTCPECQQKLPENNLEEHINKHNTDLTFVNNNIKFIYFNKDNDDVDISEESADEIDSSDTEKNYKIYHCVICKNCFGDKDEVNQHVCTSNSKQCMYCRLLFPLQTIKKHIKDHERYKDMTKNNIKLIIYDENKKDKFNTDLNIFMRNYYVSDDDDVMDNTDDDYDERVDETVENDTGVNKNDYVTKSQDDLFESESNTITKVDAKKKNKKSHKDIIADRLFKYKLLKCRNCCLNFAEKKTADEHICSSKVTWNECEYCNNLFNDSEYAVHMQYHDFDKEMSDNIIIKYFDVKEKTSSNDTGSQNEIDDVDDVESDQNNTIVSDDENLDETCENNNSNKERDKKNDDIQGNSSTEKVKREESNDQAVDNSSQHTVTATVTENSIVEDEESTANETSVNILYKCECELHFLNIEVASNHTFRCKTERSTTQNCSKCNLTFISADLFQHIMDHHANKGNTRIVNLTDVNVTDAIFKCHSCELLFTTKTHLYRHYKTCKDGVLRKINCDKCGLEFHQSCYTLHLKKHHSRVNLSADQLIVEVINKVDVPKSYLPSR